MLFLLGTAAYAGGVLAAFAGTARSGEGPVSRPLAWALVVVAAIGGLAALGGFAGVAAVPIDKIAGGSIGLGAALLIPASLQIARAARG
jgi:hypothetical protein